MHLCTLSALLRCSLFVAASAGLLAGSHAHTLTKEPSTTPGPVAAAIATGEMRLPSLQPQPESQRCTPPQSHAATQGEAPQQLALGGSHCWWACYPGSGCQYICNYYPQ